MRAYYICLSVLTGLLCAGGAKGDVFTIQPLTQDLLTALAPYQRTGSSQPGHTAYSSGQTVFMDQNGTITDIGAPNLGSTLGVIGVDGSDRVFAIAGNDPSFSSCISCNGLWQWQTGTWQELAASDIFYLSPSASVNYSGQIALSVGGNPGKPYFWDGSSVTSVKPTGYSPFSSLTSIDLNNSGQALYTVQGGGFSDRPFLYEAGQSFWLSDLISPGSGWDLDNALNLQLLESGYITGTASFNGTMTDFVFGPPLTATPEPGTAVLLLSAAGALILLARRRRAA